MHQLNDRVEGSDGRSAGVAGQRLRRAEGLQQKEPGFLDLRRCDNLAARDSDSILLRGQLSGGGNAPSLWRNVIRLASLLRNQRGSHEQ